MRHEKSGFFNALNLASLKANRPAPLEAPTECCDFESTEDFLQAWALWYDALDESVLPKADAQKKAEKKELLVPDAFAGLLVFDLLCLAAVQRMFPTETFKKAAEFAEILPFATSSQKHAAAAAFLDRQRAAIVLVQEARSLDEHPAIASRYQRLDHHWERKQVGRIETRTLRGRFSKIVSILFVLVSNDLLVLLASFKSSSGTSRSSLAKTLIRGF